MNNSNRIGHAIGDGEWHPSLIINMSSAEIQFLLNSRTYSQVFLHQLLKAEASTGYPLHRFSEALSYSLTTALTNEDEDLFEQSVRLLLSRVSLPLASFYFHFANAKLISVQNAAPPDEIVPLNVYQGRLIELRQTLEYLSLSASA